MKAILVILACGLLVGCVSSGGKAIPESRKEAYLDKAACVSTYGLLLEFGPARACPLIVQALDRYSSDDDQSIRRRVEILNALYHVPVERNWRPYTQVVRRALSDRSPEARLYLAGFIATRFPERDALRYLRPMLKDPDASVRERVQEAIDGMAKSGTNNMIEGIEP